MPKDNVSMGDFFKELKLDAWYKVLVYISGIGLLVSLFVDVKGVSNIQLQLISVGILLVGLGEWRNHKKDSWIKAPNVYTGPAMVVTQTVWRPDVVGIAFDIAGIVLAGWVIINLARSTPISAVTGLPTQTVVATTTPAYVATSIPIPTAIVLPNSTP